MRRSRSTGSFTPRRRRTSPGGRPLLRPPSASARSRCRASSAERRRRSSPHSPLAVHRPGTPQADLRRPGCALVANSSARRSSTTTRHAGGPRATPPGLLAIGGVTIWTTPEADPPHRPLTGRDAGVGGRASKRCGASRLQGSDLDGGGCLGDAGQTAHRCAGVGGPVPDFGDGPPRDRRGHLRAGGAGAHR